jgi:hypothetical protein
MVACVLVTVILLGPVQSPQAAASQEGQIRNADIIAYGATPAGIAATIQARRMGKTAILIEPSSHVGGLTSGGLGATDTGDKSVIGGISREFYRRLKKHYDDPGSWKLGDRSKLPGYRPMEDAIWVFEPGIAEKTLRGMLAEEGVELILGEWLDRAKGGVVMESGRITRIRTISGKAYSAKVFLDTSYEGDLMAAAGVDYAVGRESNAKYGETLNGWQLSKNVHNHRFVKKVDGFVKPGDPASGLVFGIDKGPLPRTGDGDNRVQAYCFRMCMTQVDSNKVDFAKPEDYDEAKYELLLRNLEAGDLRFPMHPLFMPNGKTDTNNNGAVSTDFIGFSNDYPDASYERRKEIIQAHLSWQKGLMWTLKYHPRSPEAMKKLMAPWGMAKDEFVETGNWSHQIYVREARRMVGAHVMTELECRGVKPLQSPVGMGSYNMDSHNCTRIVDKNGFVQNEGDIQVSPGGPYSISYLSLCPKKDQCQNLLVPVCLSCSHIAYGSIRMEPVFFILGQSAATAACLAIDNQQMGKTQAVQEVPYSQLRERLIKDGQVLEKARRPNPPGTSSALPPLDPAKMQGVVIDNPDAKISGIWSESSSLGGYVGTEYLHDGDANKGNLAIRFDAQLPTEGALHEIRIYYSSNPNRSKKVPVTLISDGQPREFFLDQTKATKGGYFVLGVFPCSKKSSVVISNAGTKGYVVVDAVQWIPVKPE